MEHLIGVLGIFVILGSIVFVHEFGHFFIAKLSKMTVHEFSLGFGPPLLTTKRHGTQYSLRAFPLGGYVRIAGMEPGEENEPNGFYSKGFIAKFATILAGATMNVVLALIVFIIIGLAVGYPTPAKRAVIQEVVPGAPAAKAHLQPGDILVEINGVKNPGTEAAPDLIDGSKGPVQLVVERQGRRFPVRIAPVAQQFPVLKGIELELVTRRVIGVEIHWPLMRQTPALSIANGAKSLSHTLRFAVANIRYIISGKAKLNQIGGPVMVMRASYEVSKGALSSREKFADFLERLALFSVLIGFFNVLPIPALDGGHLMTIVTEAIYTRFTKKTFDRNKVALVHAVGLIILFGFIILVTTNDLSTWITGKPLFGGK